MLRPVSIFRGLHKSTLFEVARKSAEVSYSQGETVVRQGDPGDALCIVVDGSVEVRRDDQAVAQLTAGNYFGELSLIDGEPRSATVVALEDVVILTLKSEDFDALLDVPYVMNAVMTNLARLVREAQATGDKSS
jgi:CRP-like cAMP-binding protein